MIGVVELTNVWTAERSIATRLPVHQPRATRDRGLDRESTVSASEWNVPASAHQEPLLSNSCAHPTVPCLAHRENHRIRKIIPRIAHPHAFMPSLHTMFSGLRLYTAARSRLKNPHDPASCRGDATGDEKESNLFLAAHCQFFPTSRGAADMK